MSTPYYPRLPDERSLEVDGFEVATVAPYVNGNGVYLTLFGARDSLRSPMRASSARKLAALLIEVADEVEKGP